MKVIAVLFTMCVAGLLVSLALLAAPDAGVTQRALLGHGNRNHNKGFFNVKKSSSSSSSSEESGSPNPIDSEYSVRRHDKNHREKSFFFLTAFRAGPERRSPRRARRVAGGL